MALNDICNGPHTAHYAWEVCCVSFLHHPPFFSIHMYGQRPAQNGRWCFTFFVTKDGDLFCDHGGGGSGHTPPLLYPSVKTTIIGSYSTGLRRIAHICDWLQTTEEILTLHFYIRNFTAFEMMLHFWDFGHECKRMRKAMRLTRAISSIACIRPVLCFFFASILNSNVLLTLPISSYFHAILVKLISFWVSF